MDGQSLLQEDTQESAVTVAALRDFIFAWGARAREDVREFFELVMEEETTRKPIVVVPHQAVLLDFIMAHDRSVAMLPIGHSKSFAAAGLTLWLLGKDPTLRGAVVSSTQGQAAKIVGMVRDYIETSTKLEIAFPELRKSVRQGDSWTQTEITVERPAGIRDASLVAVGIDGAIAGARLNWIIVDDILDRENTATKEQRDKVYEWFDSSVLSRLDPRGARIVVINTAWHPDDLVHRLERLGWATIRMDVEGQLLIKDDVDRIREGQPQWDSDHVRPASSDPNDPYCVLVAHDHLPKGERTLWPQRMDRQLVDKKRREHLPYRFNQLYMNVCRDDATARCKIEWIEACKLKSRQAGLHTLVSEYRGPNLTFTGVDLAVSPGEEHDDTAFFTFECMPNGMRRILDIEIGQMDGPSIVKKLIDKQKRYNSIVRVENNACFVPGTRVLTERGYVPIEHIRVGDRVWTHCQRWRPVMQVLSGTSKTIVTTRPKGGLPVRSTLNHWFWMRRAGRVPGRKGGHHRPVGDPQWVSTGVVDRPAYVSVPIPCWKPRAPRLILEATRNTKRREVEVDFQLALFLGLYMAEGHTTKGQTTFTLARRETHLAAFIERVFRRIFPDRRVTRRFGDGTRRLSLNSTSLARAVRWFGKSRTKHPPFEWYGWPLPIRLGMVRGWLMGDGCVQTNNAKTEWPKRFFSGASISRDWMLFVRSALLEAGYRPTLTENQARARVSRIGDREIRSGPIYTLSLNAEDSFHLRKMMGTRVENAHWQFIGHNGRRSNSCIVHEGAQVWARCAPPRVPIEPYDGPVYNLVVEEDESYVVEDMVVHNAQDYILQFIRERNASVPIKPHTTGRVKAHPEHGVEGLFIELFNGAWYIPNDSRGECHPAVQKWIDACLYYSPTRHTDDVQMSCYFAREQAKEWGVLSGSDTASMSQQGSIGMAIMSR